jgi:hypothetical protein
MNGVNDANHFKGCVRDNPVMPQNFAKYKKLSKI